MAARKFNVPGAYASSIVSIVKNARSAADPRKRDLSPSILDFGPLRFKIARHFGFCFGVEHAIDIAWRALEENPGRRIFLLSEMIHNPRVNGDLRAAGVQFLRTTTGKQLIPFETLTPDDVVIIPAFGASLDVESKLAECGVDTMTYDTTCPFVEKVWNKSERIGGDGYTVIIHGKRYHEEMRATFSRASRNAPAVVVRDLREAEDLARLIRGEADAAFFFDRFRDRYSPGFDPRRDLQRIGVVNQTTMLATETQAIARLFRQAILDRYGEAELSDRFADTSDTLCYATNENQNATLELIASGGDLGIVVGGYNSSNTTHLLDLCTEKMPAYFVRDASELVSSETIRHFDPQAGERRVTNGWLPVRRPLDVVLTAGASCPDALLDEVIRKMTGWTENARALEDALAPFASGKAA